MSYSGFGRISSNQCPNSSGRTPSTGSNHRSLSPGKGSNRGLNVSGLSNSGLNNGGFSTGIKNVSRLSYNGGLSGGVTPSAGISGGGVTPSAGISGGGVTPLAGISGGGVTPLRINSTAGVNFSAIHNGRSGVSSGGNATSLLSNPLNNSTFSISKSSIHGQDTLATQTVLAKCRDTLETQARDLEKERFEKSQLNKKLHDLDAELLSEKSQLHIAQTRIAELQRQVDMERRRKDESYEDLQLKFDRLKSENQDLTTKFTIQNSEIQTYKGSEEKLAILAAQKSGLESKLESFKREKEEAQDREKKLSVEYITIEQKLQSYRFDNEELNQKVCTLVQRIDNADEALVRSRSRVNMLEQQLGLQKDSYETEFERNKEEYEQQMKVKEEFYREEIQTYKEKYMLKDKYDHMEKELLEKISDLESKHREEMSDLVQKYDNSMFKIKEMEIEGEHRKKEIERLEAAMKQSDAISQERLEQVTQKELPEWKKKCEQLTKDLAFLTESNKHLTEKIEDLVKNHAKELETRVADEKIIAENRIQDLKDHHLVETDLFKKEIERLSKEMEQRSVDHTAAISRLHTDLEHEREAYGKKELEFSQSISNLQIHQEKQERSFQSLIEDKEKQRYHIEQKCESLLEALETANEKLALLNDDWTVRWEKERYELRRVYEKKIESLQRKISELRKESAEVRKMIVGAASDLYNDYNSNKEWKHPDKAYNSFLTKKSYGAMGHPDQSYFITSNPSSTSINPNNQSFTTANSSGLNSTMHTANNTPAVVGTGHPGNYQPNFNPKIHVQVPRANQTAPIGGYEIENPINGTGLMVQAVSGGHAMSANDRISQQQGPLDSSVTSQIASRRANSTGRRGHASSGNASFSMPPTSDQRSRVMSGEATRITSGNDVNNRMIVPGTRGPHAAAAAAGRSPALRKVKEISQAQEEFENNNDNFTYRMDRILHGLD